MRLWKCKPPEPDVRSTEEYRLGWEIGLALCPDERAVRAIRQLEAERDSTRREEER
jgi:hypothetical protein